MVVLKLCVRLQTEERPNLSPRALKATLGADSASPSVSLTWVLVVLLVLSWYKSCLHHSDKFPFLFLSSFEYVSNFSYKQFSRPDF